MTTIRESGRKFNRVLSISLDENTNVYLIIRKLCLHFFCMSLSKSFLLSCHIQSSSRKNASVVFLFNAVINESCSRSLQTDVDISVLF